LKWVLILSLMIVVLFGRFFAPSHLVADPGPKLVIELTVTPDEVSIGDIVELTVRATHPPESVINVEPEFHQGLQPLSLPKIRVGYQNTNQISTEFVWSLQFLSTTSSETVPVTILLIDDQGQTEELVTGFQTPSFRSLLPLGQIGLNGHQSQERVSLEDQTNYLIMAIVPFLVALVLIYIAWKYFWANNESKSNSNSASSPEGVARERLSALHEYDLSNSEVVEAFYDQISTIIRTYLVAKFDFPADSFTSEELRSTMADQGIKQWQARLVSELLLRSDLAVFAKIIPDPQSIDQDLTLAYEIIEYARGES